MTARAISGASMIPQGEVATLMKATPAEVQALVEEHTGLAPLTKARDIARREATVAESKAEALPGTQEDVDFATVEAAETQQAEVEALAKKDAAQAALRAAQETKRQAEGEVVSLRQAERRVAQAQRDVAVAQARAEDARAHYGRLVAGAEASGVDVDGDLSQAVAEAEGKAQGLAEQAGTVRDSVLAVKAARKQQQATSMAVDAADAAEQEALDAAEDAAEALAQMKEEVEELRIEESECEQTARDAHAEAMIHRATSARLGKAVLTLTQAGQEHSCCPTCQNELDDVDGLIVSMQADIDAAEADCAQASGREQEATRRRMRVQKTLAGLGEEMGRQQEVVAAVGLASAAAREARGRDTAARQEADKAHTALATLLGVDTSTSDDDLFDLAREQYSTIMSQRDSILETSRLIEEIHHAAARRDDAAQSHQQALDVARNLHAPTPEAMQNAEHAATVAAQEENIAATALADAQVEHSTVHALNQANQMKAEEETARWAAKKDATQQALIARGKASALAALRSELLADYTRAICRGASDLLASFGGEYVAFHLDEDFIPRAELADGRLVRTALLSGGESALVGLAFRIGITLHLASGGLPEQVLCDEVTNYLDEAGRRSVLSALNRLFSSVVLISHTQEALDFAARVHNMRRTPLGATSFEQHSGVTPQVETAETIAA